MTLLELLEINNEKKENSQDKINIICLYPSYNMLSAIFADETIFIAALAVYREVLKSEEFLALILKNKHRIGRITSSLASYEEFYAMFKTDYQLNIDEISKYRNAQLDCTREMTRSVLPIVESDYRYFISLNFWLSIFNDYPIRFVFCGTAYHGNLLDSLAYNIARQHKIPVYFLSEQLAAHGKRLIAVKKILKDEELSVCLKDILGESKIDLKTYCFNKVIQGNNTIQEKNNNLFWMKLHRKIKFFINNLKLSQKELFLLMTNKFKSHFTYGILEIAECLAYIKELGKIYKLISYPIDKNEKYIYFSLHFEPEASILNSSVCASQLFYIKMVADNLPAGWKVYVKEHPCQFLGYDQRIWYCFYGIKNFRPKTFYAHLYKMRNVKIINYTVSSEELVKHASAVVSIRGTINFECLMSGKPLLYFDNLMSVINVVKNGYKINNGRDVYNALKSIDNNEFNDNFHEEELTPYLFEYDNKSDWQYNEREEKKFTAILNWIIADSYTR